MNTYASSAPKSAYVSDGSANLLLADSERDLLADAANWPRPDPYVDPGEFRVFAGEVWKNLRGSTRDRFLEFAAGASHLPELHVQNLPTVPDLPATPEGGSWARTTTGHFSEMLMVTFTTGLGYPTSYADQRGGSVFHDIYPTRANASKVSSQSNEVDLGFHTEMFFHPMPPAFLMLHCLRADPAGVARTGIADLASIEGALSVADRADLRQARFALDLARLHGSYTYDGRPISEDDLRPCIPIISDDDAVSFRFEPALTTAMDAEGRNALHRAELAADANARHYSLREGSMLVLDNRRAAHSRTSFPARYDGTDRWLRRMMVSARSEREENGIVRSSRLDLLGMWREKGVTFTQVPYPTTDGKKI